MIKRKYELLLVDDEPANLQKLQRTFMDQYKVQLARSGEEVRRLFGLGEEVVTPTLPGEIRRLGV